MRNLLKLLFGYGGFFLFLLLEGICFYLVIRFNEEQNKIFLSTSNAVSGAVYKYSASVKDYFSLNVINRQLQEENQALLAENARLRRLVTGKEPEDMPADTIIGDTAQRRFHFVGGKIIHNSITQNNNTLTLDIGTKQGVQGNTGVIGGNGIVGIVTTVSDNYASVMSILHRQTNISASIKGKDFFGTLVWEGNDPQVMYLKAIPQHANIAVGDTVQTSGYSKLFPPGILIGRVTELNLPKGQNFYLLKVELGNDISRLKQAYVCIDEDREELNLLEGGNNE